MRRELEDKLIETFPFLYKEIAALECDDGWFGLIWDLGLNLEPLVRDAADCYHAVQVKEKFGGLRFYMNSYTEAMTFYIDKAEALAAKTCEICGTPGERRNIHPKSRDGDVGFAWFRTFCDECFLDIMDLDIIKRIS